MEFSSMLTSPFIKVCNCVNHEVYFFLCQVLIAREGNDLVGMCIGDREVTFLVSKISESW